MISVVPLVRYFRYPRSLGSMPSIGSNFFGKARGVCGNLLEKQFPLFLYTLFLLSYLYSRASTKFHNRILPFRDGNTLHAFKLESRADDKLFPPLILGRLPPTCQFNVVYNANIMSSQRHLRRLVPLEPSRLLIQGRGAGDGSGVHHAEGKVYGGL